MATVVDFCCKGPGLLSAVPEKHKRIAVIDDGDLRTKVIISKKLPDVKIIERKDVNILKIMKDLNIIMNPPYDGSLQDEIKTKYTPNKYYLTCPEVHGNQGKRDWAEITSSNYETALKSKQRFGWHLEFDTEEERLNCWKSWHLKSYMFIHSLVKSDNFNRYKNLPFLDDYTHEWTDEMLYNYFDLTEDEIKIIEKEISIIK